ncbi:MAG: serine hydrolase domain-containing protein [Vicinamibacterales bacterium]
MVKGAVRRGVLVAGIVLLATPAAAQNLAFSLFERYLDAVRQQAGIPGLAATVIQDGVTEWERGFGQRSIESDLPVLPDTPFPVGGLTQAFSATLALQCSARGLLNLDDPVTRWVQTAEPGLTVRQLLGHLIPGGGFRLDPARFTQLTPVLEDCFDRPFASIVGTELLDRLVMRASVPGTDIVEPTSEVRGAFDAVTLARYADTMRGLALPYRVERGRPVRSTVAPSGINASTGLVTSVRDVGAFTSALLTGGLLLDEPTRNLGWTAQASAIGQATPAGLGWFVQVYRGELIVWQFGSVGDAYSSLVLVLPGRRLTFALLANTDGLSAPPTLAAGDVTVSPFAALFLTTFVP